MSEAVKKTFTYIWTGKNQRGEWVKGEMSAKNPLLIKLALRNQGIMPKNVKKKRNYDFLHRKKPITQMDITIFSRQLATMIAAGIPLVQSFDIVAKGQENPTMEALVLSLKTDVESGTHFSDALKKYPQYFNDLFCNLVGAGEHSGSLELMLSNIATYKEKIESLKKKIKKALFYPAAVLIVAFVISAILLIFVVPQFQELFRGFGAELPVMTQMVLALSGLLQAYWYIVFAGIMGSLFLFKRALQRSKTLAFKVDSVQLKLPIIGNILKKAAIARFSRTLAITFSAGLPLVDALKAVSGATGNLIYAKASSDISENVSSGQALQMAMKMSGVFPNMVTQMVSIGEESGSLELMLTKVADFYEEEVDTAVDSLSSLLEPMIMAILGVIVGGLVIAMYLPIFKLGQVV